MLDLGFTTLLPREIKDTNPHACGSPTGETRDKAEAGENKLRCTDFIQIILLDESPLEVLYCTITDKCSQIRKKILSEWPNLFSLANKKYSQ
jgi:hypothetical protein